MTERDVPAGGVSLVEVLAGLAAEGYVGSFLVAPDGWVQCTACDAVVAPSELQLDGLRRLEGASDPADMAAVLAVRCRACGTRGAIVARYGPEVEPADVALLLAIEDRPRQGLDVAEQAGVAGPSPQRPRSAPSERGLEASLPDPHPPQPPVPEPPPEPQPAPPQPPPPPLRHQSAPQH